MKTDVVIVAYRSADEIDACLDAVTDRQNVASVIVIDNGDGASARRAGSRGVASAHLPSNPGFGAGVNEGAEAGQAEAILVLNPDAILADGALAAATARLQRDPEIGAVQGAILNAVTGSEERSAGRELGVVHLLGRLLHARSLLRFAMVARVAGRVSLLTDHVDRRLETDQRVDTLAATAVLVRRRAFESVGGFDERYFLYGEDLDLCARLRSHGWKLVAIPETTAVHRSGGSSRSTWDRDLRWWQGTLQFARLHWRGAKRAAAIAIGICEGVVLVLRAPRQVRLVISAIGGRS